MADRGLLLGLMRLHILHHAALEAVHGGWIAGELRRHGYTISAGTLYPMLHGLERRGYLRSRRAAGRRLYRITPAGRRALAAAMAQIRELYGELFAARP